jgi:aminomethyltransferase
MSNDRHLSGLASIDAAIARRASAKLPAHDRFADRLMLRTSLHAEHARLEARMFEFAGYEMPLHYGSQIEEHHAVRRACGLFDVSHMGVIDIEGEEALSGLDRILANDPGRLRPGGGLYSCVLSETAGVIDDVIAYRLSSDRFRLVVNAANKEKDLTWFTAQLAAFKAQAFARPGFCILSLQGPQARHIAGTVLSDASPVLTLKRFRTASVHNALWACTGYTGEDGFEIILPATDALVLWDALLAAGAKPIGLGARDSLRLEAGLNLWGLDMDETVSPLECGLGWTVSLAAGRYFLGREAFERQLERGPERKQIGVRLLEQGVLRPHQPVYAGDHGAGVLSSGAYSPTLGFSIGFARIGSADAGRLSVGIRGKRLPLEHMKTPFVRRDPAS